MLSKNLPTGRAIEIKTERSVCAVPVRLSPGSSAGPDRPTGVQAGSSGWKRLYWTLQRTIGQALRDHQREEQQRCLHMQLERQRQLLSLQLRLLTSRISSRAVATSDQRAPSALIRSRSRSSSSSSSSSLGLRGDLDEELSDDAHERTSGS